MGSWVPDEKKLPKRSETKLYRLGTQIIREITQRAGRYDTVSAYSKEKKKKELVEESILNYRQRRKGGKGVLPSSG